MILDRKKYELARARKCMTVSEMEKRAEIPHGTVCQVMQRKNARPETIGKIARALGVDVTEIIED